MKSSPLNYIDPSGHYAFNDSNNPASYKYNLNAGRKTELDTLALWNAVIDAEADRLRQYLQNWEKRTGSSTVSVGLVTSAAAGATVSGSVGMTIDVEGNIALQHTEAGGGGMPVASISGYAIFTNAPSYEELEKIGAQVGGSVDAGVAAGMEFVYIPNGTELGYFGISFSKGLGGAPIAAVELHGEVGYTSTLINFNIFGALEHLKVQTCGGK